MFSLIGTTIICRGGAQVQPLAWAQQLTRAWRLLCRPLFEFFIAMRGRMGLESVASHFPSCGRLCHSLVQSGQRGGVLLDKGDLLLAENP